VTSLLPGQVSQMWVQFLPDGKHFIYLARTSLTSSDPGAKVYVQSLDGGAPTLLLASQSRAIAVPDYLVFAQDQTLFAQRMDWKTVRKIGEPLMLAHNVAASPAYLGTSEFTASQNGVLIYGTATGSSFDQFTWYARDGSVTGSLQPVIDFQQFTLSPDGKHLALNSFHQHATGSLWLIDLASNTTTPLTTDPHAQSDPVWSPDSRYVAFDLLPNGGSDPPFVVQKIEIGSQQSQPIYGDDDRHWVEDWSADGRFLLTHDTKTFSIIPVVDNIKPKALYSTSFLKDEFHLSPDGQLIAYGEDRTGTWEVFVAAFPSFHDIKQVSQAGGVQPRWRGDGRELFFLDTQGKLMSATVERGSPLKTGIPRKLFDTALVPDPTINQYAVTGDGLKFLVLEPRKSPVESYSVILNWPATVESAP
jgi:dipeptidyl aminopeptidase/acylaminoacyl peptidase